MLDIRCECGKIVCQSNHEFVVIKCRHCKRFMYIKTDDPHEKIAVNPHFENKTRNQNRDYSKHL